MIAACARGNQPVPELPGATPSASQAARTSGSVDLKQLSAEPPESPLVKELSLKRLDNDDIRRLIVGRQISSQGGISKSGTAEPATSEVFTRYLTYIHRGDFGASTGQYQIANNMICISFPAKGSECRRFYTDKHGDIYQEYVETGSNELGKLIFR
jgi:hypothetical protein